MKRVLWKTFLVVRVGSCDQVNEVSAVLEEAAEARETMWLQCPAL